MRTIPILALVLLLCGTVLARVDDPATGEPVPGATTSPPSAPAPTPPGQRDDLTLLAHVADGATKEVRALGNGHVVFQNGAWLEFYDVSDPFEPQPGARILLQAQPSDLAVVGTTLYASLRKTEGLLIVDVSDPDAPVVLGQREGHDMLSVAVGNGLAYCGIGTPGFVIVNLADLTIAGTYDTPGSANGTAIVGTTLYVAQGASGLGIYNVANPAAPTLLGSSATPSFCTYVAVRDNLAFLAGNFGLQIVDVTNPAAPVLRSTLSVGDTTYEMTFGGDDVYLAGLGGGFRVDVGNPAAPFVVAQFSPASGFSIAVEGTTALLAERFVGLRILSADALEARALVPTAGFSNRLHLQGSLLHVVDLGGGVRIWDVADPAHPVLASDTATPPNSQDLALAGDLSFVVNSNNTGEGLWILDVALPAAPVVLDVFNTMSNPYGVEAQGDRLYVANGNGGLLLVDVTDPAAPTSLGSLAFGSQAFDVRARGTTAYVALFGAGLVAVDTSVPSFMSILDQEAGWGFLNALDVTGDIAWVAAQTGLRVVDISTPTNLTSVSFNAFGGQPRDVVHEGDVFLADDFYGLRQVDVTNPAAPTLRASYPSADRGMGVDADGDLVVLAAGETGVYVFRKVSTAVDVTPSPQARLEAAPNPFNPRLDIRWELPAPSPVRVQIHDARGHLVRTFDLGGLPAGAGQLTWDGTDDTGRSCASGAYLLRLETGSAVASRTVTLIR